MIQKEEDTVVLLSPIEVEEESQREENNSPRRPFSASGISSSFLCGAGIFIGNIVVWCSDPRESCKDSEIFRVTALFGGVISSLIVGRAVDYYGRRSSLFWSVFLWVVVSLFLVFLPSQAEIHVNVYNAPLSNLYVWHGEHKSSPTEFVPAYTIKTYDTEVSVSHIIAYSYSQNTSLGNHLFSTQPTPIKSAPIQKYGSFLNAAVANDNLSIKSFSSSKGKMLEYSSLKPVNNIESLNSSSFFLPWLSFHLFLGAASAASIVAVSVYAYETSPTDSQAWWISLSNFFSSLYILCLPIIHGHLLLLATTAWLPVIILGFLMLIPVRIPDCLSLPQSPHFLLLSVFIQERKTWFSNPNIARSSESKEVSLTSKESETKRLSSIFQAYGNATLGYVKIPFKKSKIKIHDASSKSSASDSDDSGCFYNDKLKHVVLESRREHSLSASQENEGESESIHYQRSELTFSQDHQCSAHIKNMSGADKYLGRETKLSENLEESVNLMEDVIEECEEECDRQVTLDAGEPHDGHEAQGENAISVPQRWSDSQNLVFSWQERESLRILSYLNGKKEGYMEWKNIKKTLKEDGTSMKYSAKNTFFHFDASSLCSTLHLVTKVGLPLMIIHMFSCEYGVVITLSETIFSKLGFCDLSGPATITSLQVLSSATSVLILDKLRNQVVLISAAVVMATSFITLGFLLPTIQKTVNDERFISTNAFTPNPALPTLYPLLPTPLPQVLQGKENICSDNLLENSPSQAWSQVGIALDSQKNIPLNLPAIWFSALVLALYVFVSSLVLLPLTRLVLVSYFPITKRGSGVGISVSMEWVLRLITVFFPISFLYSGVGFSLCAGALFLSVLMLCFSDHELFSKDSIFQRTNCGKKNSHHSSYEKICNLSDVNSTAV